ncbi:uncharacterized protein DS421_9g276290 [Arachis hypogaea]|nr:uncharacterized protein DS421_9g276290 [Arachis hypogaea]
MDSENSRINLRLARIRRRIILDSQRRRKRTSLCSGNTPQDNYNGTKRRNIAKESFVAGSSSYNQVLAINKSICTQDQSNQNSMHAMRSGSPITRTLLTNVTSKLIVLSLIGVCFINSVSIIHKIRKLFRCDLYHHLYYYHLYYF